MVKADSDDVKVVDEDGEDVQGFAQDLKADANDIETDAEHDLDDYCGYADVNADAVCPGPC